MGSFSEIFKDMGEVRAYAESMKSSLSAEDYELFLYLFGLLENSGVSEVVQLQGQDVKIDRFLAPMIVDLNENGVFTLACCSGLEKEHLDSKFKSDRGYLSVAYDKGLLDYLQNELKNPLIVIMESECYLKPAIAIEVKGEDDSIKKETWGFVWKVLKRWYNDRIIND